MNLEDQPIEILSKCMARQEIYVFLSNALTYPEEPFFKEFKDTSYEQYLENCFKDLGLNLYSETEAIEQWFAQPIDEQDFLNSLQIEHTRLFITTSGESLLVPPYESCYRNVQGLVMDRHTVEQVIQFYQQSNLLFSDDSDLLPDHIAVELEFMSYLVERELSVRENQEKDELQTIIEMEKSFLSQHFAGWLPLFIARLKQHKQLLFYHYVAEVMEVFLAYELNNGWSTVELLEKMEGEL